MHTFQIEVCMFRWLDSMSHAVWLEQGTLQRLVLVVTSTASKEVLERWTFDVETNKDMVAGK